MAELSHLALTVEGRGVKPNLLKLRDLVGLLGDLDSAISATAFHLGKPDWELHVCLTKIGEGSAIAELGASEQSQLAAKVIGDSISNRDSEPLPQPAVASILEMQKRASRNGWSLTLENGAFSATILPDRPVFLDALVSGGTSIFGAVNGVGGKRPTAKIELANGEKITAELASRALAQELGKMLYEWVVLEGEASWHARSMDLRKFKVIGLGEYRDSLASDAFSALKGISPGIWDEVDPDEFIREQRDES